MDMGKKELDSALDRIQTLMRSEDPSSEVNPLAIFIAKGMLGAFLDIRDSLKIIASKPGV